MGKLSPRIPRLNTINTMGPTRRWNGVHPMVPWKTEQLKPTQRKFRTIPDSKGQRVIVENQVIQPLRQKKTNQLPFFGPQKTIEKMKVFSSPALKIWVITVIPPKQFQVMGSHGKHWWFMCGSYFFPIKMTPWNIAIFLAGFWFNCFLGSMNS